MIKKKVFGEGMRKEEEGEKEGTKERRKNMLRYVCIFFTIHLLFVCMCVNLFEYICIVFIKKTMGTRRGH